LIGGEQFDAVKQAMEDVTLRLTALSLEIPPSKCQGPTRELKFLRVWWIKGALSIPRDTLEKIEQRSL